MIVLTAAAVLLAGCASVEPGGPPTPREPNPTPVVDTRDWLVGSGLVLDDGPGPKFCLGAIRQSLPPQCSGLPLRDWQWPADAEQASGVIWADAHLLGTYDGQQFTVLRALRAEEVAAQLPAEQPSDLASPCPEPSGGWQPPDPTRAHAADQQKVFAAAEQLTGFAGSWLDDRGDPAQDPARVVVNVRVTGDLRDAEESLRAVWGGSLCVSQAQHTAAELGRIQKGLRNQQGLLGSAPGRDVVDITVVYDDGTLQLELDKRYGPGLVKVISALRPYQS